MRFMARLSFFFYVLLVTLVGCITLLFVVQAMPFSDLEDAMYVAYYDQSARMFLGFFAIFLLFVNFIFSKTIAGDEERGRNIAFDNPSGRVSVSLKAMEDLVKKVISQIEEVKEVSSYISANKKGLEVRLRLILNADVNIPEMTSNLQEIVKRKIQDTIGLEEKVVVRVHIMKISPGTKKVSRDKKDNSDTEDQASQMSVPFHGYRA